MDYKHLKQNPDATYPDIRYLIGTLPNGKYHVHVYGLGDDLNTSYAEALAEEIEIRLNAHDALLEALKRYVGKFGNCGDVYDAALAAIALLPPADDPDDAAAERAAIAQAAIPRRIS